MNNFERMTIEEENFKLGNDYIMFQLEKIIDENKDAFTIGVKVTALYYKYLRERGLNHARTSTDS